MDVVNVCKILYFVNDFGELNRTLTQCKMGPRDVDEVKRRVIKAIDI